MWLPLGYQQETNATGLNAAAIGLRTAGNYGSITMATNASPIVITSAGHGLVVPAPLSGLYDYVYTWVTAAGETTPSPYRAARVNGAQLVVYEIPPGPTGTIGRKIYRTAAGGAPGSEKLLATLNDNTTTTFLDQMPDSALGAAVPASNAAGIAAPTDAPLLSASLSQVSAANPAVIVEGVTGNVGANGQWPAAPLDANTFSLVGSQGSGAYVSGGTWRRFPAGAQWVLMRAETADVRWRDDGVDPTATVGQLLKATDVEPFLYQGGRLAKLKFIGTTTAAILNIEFYKQA